MAPLIAQLTEQVRLQGFGTRNGNFLEQLRGMPSGNKFGVEIVHLTARVLSILPFWSTFCRVIKK